MLGQDCVVQRARLHPQPVRGTASGCAGSQLLTEELAPRSSLPPLLLSLGERAPEALDYLGSSFGLTLPLLSFWGRTAFSPVYLRQTASETTGTASRHASHIAAALAGIHHCRLICHVAKGGRKHSCKVSVGVVWKDCYALSGGPVLKM